MVDLAAAIRGRRRLVAFGLGAVVVGTVTWAVYPADADARQGLSAVGARHTLVDGLLVHDVGAEGIQFHGNSTDNVVENSEVRRSGTGITLGPERSDRNKVLHNLVGPDVRAEHVDIRE